MRLPHILLPLLLVPGIVQAQAVDAKVDEAFARYAALPAMLIPILKEAVDKESADAAAPKLLEALPAVYDARSSLHNLRLDEQQTRLVRQKYGERMQREWGKLFEQIYRLQGVACYGSIPFFKQFQTLCMMLEK